MTIDVPRLSTPLASGDTTSHQRHGVEDGQGHDVRIVAIPDLPMKCRIV
eukprot:CAMPEP_0206424940 /NCGR_PEP_ID=MMETSP0324_2-20121206/3509_1 /ASSEMBLY_ACC=CAM_ASM_000836 /TAXON_ID=2866 /ORGANISM="Crypthecodinium cohnii, Strain Seligo" /LENGTH=48 /DNA_ID= /DNA_START= /DNA_END= /DNA_ORIENTATION=